MTITGQIMEIERRYSDEFTEKFKVNNPDYKGQLRVTLRFGNEPREALNKLNEFESNGKLKQSLMDTLLTWATMVKPSLIEKYEKNNDIVSHFAMDLEVIEAWNRFNQLEADKRHIEFQKYLKYKFPDMFLENEWENRE